MRIYKVNTEHRRYGRNWGSVKVDARTFDEAIRKAKKVMSAGEKIESVEILASTE